MLNISGVENSAFALPPTMLNVNQRPSDDVLDSPPSEPAAPEVPDRPTSRLEDRLNALRSPRPLAYEPPPNRSLANLRRRNAISHQLDEMMRPFRVPVLQE